MNIKKSIFELIGNTPLLSLERIKKEEGIEGQLLAKLENFNLTGSAKDRPALEMILQAEEEGLLNENSVIIEPTSGNMGIALAAIGVSRGYKVIIVMPEKMSTERAMLMRAFGAEVIRTPYRYGMQGAIDEALRLKEETENAFIPSQFDNSANPLAHYKTTGPEIWRDTDGEVDIFVAGIGTGGTISGVGKFLKEKNPDIKIIGVEPNSSPLLRYRYWGPHKIQGIGANFIPENLDREIYDEIIGVEDKDALKYAKMFAKKEGISVGISSGAALCAAVSVAKRPENKDKTIVTLFCDTGDRYLSTELFTE